MSSILTSIEKHFKPINFDTLSDAGWYWNGANEWYELNVYNFGRDYWKCIFDNNQFCEKKIPHILNMRIRFQVHSCFRDRIIDKFPVVYNNTIQITWLFDVVGVLETGTDIKYRDIGFKVITITDMGELQSKILEVLDVVKNDWKVPEQYINKNLL